MPRKKAVVAPKEFKKRVRKQRNNKHHHTQTLEAVERRYKVVKMRRDGMSIPDIAADLGVSLNTVANDLVEILDKTYIEIEETVEQARNIQLQRLDALLIPAMKLATTEHNELSFDPRTGAPVIVTMPPDPKYAGVVLQIEARRAKLLALDKPETKIVEVSGIREYVGVDYSKV